MTELSAPTAPFPTSSDDYRYTLEVPAPPSRIVEALTDPAVIARWWTVVTSGESDGRDVRLYIGDGEPFIDFTVEHDPAAGTVRWAVTGCAVLADWVATTPTWTIHPAAGAGAVSFRHVGLGPALECFEMCRAGWDHFLPSLEQYLRAGAGRPNQPRQAPA